MYGEGNKATGYSGSVVVDNQQAALFKTNIDGIYYAVSLQTQGGGTVVYIPAAGPSIHWLNGMSNTTLEGTTWKASIVLFQSTRFSGNTSNINALQPDISDGTQLSKMGRGDPDASANIVVNASSFLFPVKPATCQAMSLSGGDGVNTVNFDDIKKSDVENNKLPSRDFDIKLTDCTNTVSIEPKITAQNTLTSGNTTLLENQLNSNAASGIGV